VSDSTGDLPRQLFNRIDESPDSEFYREARLVAHIDPETITALSEFYSEFIPQGCDVLDLMSSWISHLPETGAYGRVAGLGMNAVELLANPRLSDHVVHDLNVDAQLPYEQASFDRALIAVSIQYLIKPLDVLGSLHKVLRPGGRVCIAMSHRLFPTKAIRAFHELAPEDRIRLVSGYLGKCGFERVRFIDRSPPAADPLWLVTGDVPEN
jgi:SAM-dependent methyltransferase